MIYWDTSCVLKLYAREDDSSVYADLATASEGPLVSSELLSVELYSALRQKELRHEIRKGAAEPLFSKFQDDVAMERLSLLPLGGDVICQALSAARRCYEHTPPLPLRSLDGLHLGTALAAGVARIVTTDERMRSAAALLGLYVVVCGA